jgi:hypothetical protein
VQQETAAAAQKKMAQSQIRLRQRHRPGVTAGAFDVLCCWATVLLKRFDNTEQDLYLLLQ